MEKKKVVLIISICVALILGGCTIVSYRIYDRNLPSVNTFYFKTDIDGNLWTSAYYLPEESITSNSAGETVVYKLQKRMGWFAEEFYVQKVPLDFYYENGELVYRKDGYVRVILVSLEEGDQIVKEPVGLKDGLTVKWESGERGKYNAAVWY